MAELSFNAKTLKYHNFSFNGPTNHCSPAFSFAYVAENNYGVKVLNEKLLQDFLLRLKELSQLTWQDISNFGRHKKGSEHMPVNEFRNKTEAKKILDSIGYKKIT